MEYKYISAIVLKKGRKYLHCEVDGYKSKVLITPSIKDCSVGDKLRLRVKSHWEYNNYMHRKVLMFYEPSDSEANLEEARQQKLKEIERWSEYVRDYAIRGSLQY